MRMRDVACLATALVLSCVGTVPACADVRISGSDARLVLQANDASLTDILSALQSSFRVDVRVKGNVTQHFTGTYTGSLRHVLGRLLGGTDYVLKMSPSGLQIVLVGASAKSTFTRLAPVDEFNDDDPALKALAAAAAGHEGSRTTRIRDQRARMNPQQATADPY
jgi:hypothetical protein